MKPTKTFTGRRRKLSTFGLLIFIILAGRMNGFAQYALEKVDEFKINSLYRVDIVDYYPQDKLYLGYINASEGTRIVLINEKGDFIANEILVGEGPNQSVSAVNSMAFTEDGNIWLQTPVQLLLYDQKLAIKERIRYPSSLKMQIYGRMEVFPFFHQKESGSGFSFITNSSGTNSYIFKKDIGSDLIEIYEVEEDELYRIAPVSDRPMYENFAGSLFRHLYSVVYTLDSDHRKLYLTTQRDNEITVYDLTTHKLASRIKVVHGDFNVREHDLPSYGRVSLGARNHKIFSLDEGLVVLDYIREIPYGTYEKKIADDPTYHHFQDPAYHRLILFDGTKQLSGDLSLPPNAKLMTSLPGNRLLMQLINPDVEEDYIRYGIYKVVETK